jgi:hypothetical protein
VILVVAHGALDVAVVVLQRVLPRLAVLVGPAARGARRVLDGQVQAVQVDMALGVVPGLLLAVGWLRQGVVR